MWLVNINRIFFLTIICFVTWLMASKIPDNWLAIWGMISVLFCSYSPGPSIKNGAKINSYWQETGILYPNEVMLGDYTCFYQIIILHGIDRVFLSLQELPL